MTTLSVEDRALRMLAAGDSVNDITSSTGLTRDEIEKLKRDFPGTHTHQPRPLAAPQRLSTPVVEQAPNPNLSRAIDAAGVTPPVSLVSSPPPAAAPEATNPLAILQEARTHSLARVRNLADRIGKHLFELEELIAEHQAAEEARRAKKEAENKARAEVALLEAKLAAAKAKLRDSSKSSSTWSDERKATARESLQRLNVPSDCPICGRTFGHAGAMANHKKHCTGSNA